MPNDNQSQLLPALAAGVPLIGQAAGAIWQGAQNKKTRQWNEKMYGIQRQDALSDWTMQNAYNSPAAQMQRLREAGLNPNLVYGHGADAQGGIVRSTDVKGWNPQSPSFDTSSTIGAYQDAKIRQIQSDNLKIQQTLMQQNLEMNDQKLKNLIAAEFKTYADTFKSQSQRDSIDTDVQLKGVKLQYAPRVAEMSLQGMQAAVQKAQADTELSQAKTTYTLDENERRALVNGMTIEQAAVKLLQMKLDYVQAQKMNPKDLDLRQAQIDEIKERMRKIKADAKGSDEKARLLQSTPNWYEQQGIGTLRSIMSGVGKGIGVPKK